MSKTPIYRIYTGDYSAVGYRDGVADGKQGKPKSHFGMLKRHWFNYLWKFRESGSSYCTGYNTGYEGGLKIRENIYHQTGESTMSLESYDRILAGLHTATNNVRLNINQLESSLAHYEQQINAMQSAGLLEDYAVQLRKHQGLEMRIKKLQEFLEELLRKLKEIEQQISALKAEAQRSGA